MENVLGLILFAVFIAAVIALAAAATWIVVRVSPAPSSGKKKAEVPADST